MANYEKVAQVRWQGGHQECIRHSSRRASHSTAVMTSVLRVCLVGMNVAALPRFLISCVLPAAYTGVLNVQGGLRLAAANALVKGGE